MSRAANGAGSVYKTAQGWRGSILLNGRRKYVSGPTKTAVGEKLRQLKRQADDGFVQKGRSPKLKTWITQWLNLTAPSHDLAASKQARRHSLKTDSDYRKMIDRYLPGWLGSITLTKLEPEHLEDAYRDLDKQGLAQSTIYKLHSIIRASLTHAVKRGRIPRNVAQDVVNPPQSRSVTKQEPYTRTEQQAIRKVLAGSRSHARGELALTLGLRPGETLGLEWSHIDFEERSIEVVQQIQTIDGELRLVPYTKTTGRKIPLPDFLATILLEHQDEQLIEKGAAGDKWATWESDGKPHSFVFTSALNPGMPITPDGDRTQWKRLLKRAGLLESPPYRARHTAASEMIAAGLDLTVIAEILGHSVKVLQDTYAHAIEERKIAAATVLDLKHATIHSIDALIDATAEITESR